MSRDAWDKLLSAARDAHRSHAQLSEFCPFPQDITPQPVKPHDVPAAHLFTSETGFTETPYSALHLALKDASLQAHWRETYKGTTIGQDFMDRFGCYCLIGPDGPFTSKTMRAWMVYMPPNLYYTWHHHPAEEMYLVLAGSARFFRQGDASEILCSGQVSHHSGNQPHAMETDSSPVLAYVVWRDCFESPPVLTSKEALT